VNWRAIGCGTLAAAAFVAVGIFAIWRSYAPAGCPESLQYEPAPFVSDGAPTPQPTLAGVDEPLEAGGQFSFGLAAWSVWMPSGDAPTASGEPLPERIVLDCGDGTFQAYRRDAA
jgi:hypothetical protein